MHSHRRTHTHTCVFCKSNEIKCADNALTVDDEQREGVCVWERERSIVRLNLNELKVNLSIESVRERAQDSKAE